MNGRPGQSSERVCERALVWHLGHFRLHDHAALLAAARDARLVFPLVVKDPRDPLGALTGYPDALQELMAGYAALGVPLLYLEGDSPEKVTDAARDARADYVYVMAREDCAGRALLDETRDELELWGFGCLVFTEETAGRPQGTPLSLSSAPLPSLTSAAPPGGTLGPPNTEGARLLGLASPRQAPSALAGGRR